MKTRLIESFYIPGQLSFVTLKRGDQYFKGLVYLDEEDLDIDSSFAGCQFAEIKARIKLLKCLLKEKKSELKALETLYHQITQLKEFPDEEHSHTCRHIRKQIAILTKDVNDRQELIDFLKENYPKVVENRISAARKLQGGKK